MNDFSKESEFAAIIKAEMKKRTRIEMTVAELGFPSGAGPIEINQRLIELGYEQLSAKLLLHAAKNPGEIYLPGTSLVLHKK